MKQELDSLSFLFTERLYRIPDYQRGYAWTEKHIKDFWGDLIQLEENKKHYLGVLTLAEVSEEIFTQWSEDYWIIKAKNYRPFYIVDGQQRLTTAIILVQSIIESVIESVEEETLLNYTTIDDIRKKFIYESKDQGISRSYIFGYEKDNPSYESLKTKIFLEMSNSSEIPQQTIYTHNLEFAKEFFKKRLEKLTRHNKENIYRNLTQSLLFNVNVHTISTNIDVFIAFETMNNRGKPLSYLELLKNRLIYLSTKFKVENYEKEKLRKTINETWKSMYHYLGKNKSKPLGDDLFLSNHFMIYFNNPDNFEDLDIDTINNPVYRRIGNYSSYLLEQKFTVKSIRTTKTDSDLSIQCEEYEEHKEKLTLKEVYSYVNNLKSGVELWYKILNPEDSDFSTEEKFWLDKLIRLSQKNGFIQTTPLIMVFCQKQKKVEERIKLLKAIERINFLELLGFRDAKYYPRGGSLQNLLAMRLSNGIIGAEKVITTLEEKSKAIVNNKEFLAHVKKLKFESGNFYNWQGIRYFLYEYDLSLQGKSKTERRKLDWIDFNSSDYETIEHIYPQNPRRGCWTSFSCYSSSQIKILQNSLGNLLPLSRSKNSTFSNSSFINKISNEDNTVGYKYGSYSEIEITQYQDWTAKEILDRGIKLLSFMEKRWSIPLGSRDEKVNFLNLKFVEEQET